MATSVLPSPVFISAIRPSYKHLAAHDLHVEVAHAKRAFARLAHDRKYFGKHIVEQLALFQTCAELHGLTAQLLVGKGLHLRFEGIDAVSRTPKPRNLALVTIKKGLEECHRDYYRSTIKKVCFLKPGLHPAAGRRPVTLTGKASASPQLRPKADNFNRQSFSFDRVKLAR